MAVKIFIPQDQVDTWVTTDKVDLAGEVMTFRKSRISLRVVPAYFFDHVSAGSDARPALLGRVKTKAAVHALGAEVYLSSVIVGETAYDVAAGLVGKPIEGTCTREAVVAAVVDAAGS
jgi:hypothetical protein